jgi:hypothetical protein
MVFRFASSWWGNMASEMWIRFKCFLTSDWENLQEEFFIQAQVLLANLSSIPFPQNVLQFINVYFAI